MKFKVIFFFPVVMLICCVSHFSAVAGIHVQLKDKGKLEAAADNALDIVKSKVRPPKKYVWGIMIMASRRCPTDYVPLDDKLACRRAAPVLSKEYDLVSSRAGIIKDGPKGCMGNKGQPQIYFNARAQGNARANARAGIRPICKYQDPEDVTFPSLEGRRPEDIPEEWVDPEVTVKSCLPGNVGYATKGWPNKNTFNGFKCGTEKGKKLYASCHLECNRPGPHPGCTHPVNPGQPHGQPGEKFCKGECKDYKSTKSMFSGKSNEVKLMRMEPGTCICLYNKQCPP